MGLTGLMMMRRMTVGLSVSLIQQKYDDCCDDVNFIGERVSDLLVIQEIAILLRSNKSKVMGLGAWKGRQD